MSNWDENAACVITVSFLAGKSLEDYIASAIRLSKHLQCTIRFKFNTREVFASQYGTVEKAMAEFNKGAEKIYT